MKPLVCYICFNRMGSTVLSLLSLLSTKDEFDLYIGDNDSRDKTWDFLMSLKDPRIREIKKFEHNYGELNIANWALSKRAPRQHFVIMENDCQLYVDEFMKYFEKAFLEVPRLGAASGWLRSLKIDSSKMVDYFYPDTVMGMFTCVKGEVMDKLGYYSEGCYIADVELNYRIRKLLHWETGYLKQIDCSIVHPFGCYNCADCKTKQGVCTRSDLLTLLPGENRPAELGRDLYCNRFYPTLNRAFWNQCGEESRQAMEDMIIQGKKVYWDSVHSGNPLPERQEKNRKRFQLFFEEQYLIYLRANNLLLEGV